jgi:hypothetical protein
MDGNNEPVIFGHPAKSQQWQSCTKWEGYEKPENQKLYDYFFENVVDKHSTADYLAGGSGYVFNKQYLQEFVAALDGPMAPRGYPPEDMAHGLTMMIRGIFPKKSTDKLGQSRFIPEPPDLWTYIHNQQIENGVVPKTNKPCTMHCITMHHISPTHMRYLHDQVYNCRS